MSRVTKRCRGDIYLKAVWKPFTYTVSFKKDARDVGGKIIPIKKVDYDREIVLPAGGFVRPGYVLMGFSHLPGGNIPEYAPGQKVKNLSEKRGGKVTLYPIWSLAVSE